MPAIYNSKTKVNIMKNATILFLTFLFFNLSAQDVDSNKDKIRTQNNRLKTNIVSKTNIEIQNTNIGDFEKFIKNDKGEIIGKFGYIDHNGNPFYFTNLSHDAAITTSTDKLHSDADLGYDLEGAGLVVLINEAGSPRASHDLFEGSSGSRVVDSSEPVSGHATWVAGIIGSNDALGLAYRGMAPSVNLQMQENYVEDYLDNLISNHSIIRSNGTYQPYFDSKTYDAPLHLEVTASGNASGIYYNLANNSKNELTVGNINDVSEYTNPMDVIYSNSGVGPTIDGRIKPDVVANGISVSSAKSSSDTAILTSGGSSASCANASGSLILVQEHYNSLVDSFMRSSTLKALAVHTATEAGSYPGPDYLYGYGLLNTYEMVQLIDENQNTNHFYEETLDNDEVFELNIQPNYTEPLIVTLAWTDPSSGQLIFPYDGNQIDTSLRALVNDLDIKVIGDNTTYYPYKLDRMNPCDPPTTGDNSFDNLEMIEIPNLPNIDGDYVIEISHKGDLVNDVQNFSLIVTGLAEENSQTIARDICIDKNEICEWDLSKQQEGKIIVEGELVVGDINSLSDNSIIVVSGATLTLSSSQLNDADIYIRPEGSLIIEGEVILNNSNITMLGEDLVTYDANSSININTSSSSVQKLGLYDEGLDNIITGLGELELLENESYLLDNICINNTITKDTIISGYNNIIVGDLNPSVVCIENESEVILIGNNFSLSNNGIIVGDGSELIVQKHSGEDELIVPNANMNPVIHKYYNGIIYPSQDCFHVPINVYDPD